MSCDACVGALTQLDAAVHPEQDVVALDVAMDDVVLVQELQRLQTLCHTIVFNTRNKNSY